MKISLKVYIPIIVVTASALTFVIVFFYSSLTYNWQKVIGERQLAVTQQTLDTLDRFIFERSQSIQVLSKLPYIQDLVSKSDLKSKTELITQVKEYSSLTGPWNSITVYDLNKNIIFTTAYPSNNQLEQNSEIDKAFNEVAAGNIYHSDAFIENSQGTPIILFAAPVRSNIDTKTIKGILIAELSWQSISNLIEKIDHFKATLYNKDGYLISSNETDKKKGILKDRISDPLLIQRAAGGESTWITTDTLRPHIPSLTSFASQKGYLNYHGNKWTLILENPVEIAYAPVNDLVRYLLIILLVIAFVNVSVAIIVIYITMIRPVGLLINAVKKIADGDLTQRVNLRTKDEVGQLAQAFNDMSTQLQVSYQTLEDEVWKRTKELQEAKAGLEQKVKERTSELEQMNKHLGDEVTRRTADLAKQLDQTKRLNEVMVGREMRIVELKKEIDTLKQK